MLLGVVEEGCGHHSGPAWRRAGPECLPADSGYLAVSKDQLAPSNANDWHSSMPSKESAMIRATAHAAARARGADFTLWLVERLAGLARAQ